MTIFLWLMGLYGLPLWFMLRVKYFANKREREFTWRANYENVDLGFSIFFILVLSWAGFIVGSVLSSSKTSDVARAFFIPARKDSMASKIFWYKMRALGLRLLFIKESE